MSDQKVKPEMCADCRFFVLWNEESGQCRRFPPPHTNANDTVRALYKGLVIAWQSVVQPWYWCGEFQAGKFKERASTNAESSDRRL